VRNRDTTEEENFRDRQGYEKGKVTKFPEWTKTKSQSAGNPYLRFTRKKKKPGN